MSRKLEALFIQRTIGPAFKKRFPGIFIYKIPDGGSGGLRPFDIFAVYSGFAICVEVKWESKLKLHQVLFLNQARENGGITAVMEKHNWKKILDYIAQEVTCRQTERKQKQPCRE